jgi:short-subunit dehydrogenase
MQHFEGHTAVITGAASGIGLALARAAAARGMRLVLADLDGERLRQAADGLGVDAGRIALHALDVSRDDEVAALADTAFARFGAVHLLCNNAGVGHSRTLLEHSADDWAWVLGVNLMSVVHGVRHFLPRMQQQEEGGHVLNTASAAGLLCNPGMAAYNVSKHGVVALSETLYHELGGEHGEIGVSVLCPAWVPTAIHLSARHRPARFGDAAPPSAASAAYAREIGRAVTSARLSADDIAAAAFDGIAARRLYIVPHAKVLDAVVRHAQDLAAGVNPPTPRL